MEKKQQSAGKYRYTAYGLNIESDIKLDELTSGYGEADISVIIGKVPEELANPVDSNDFCQISENEILIDLKDFARYYIVNGCSITIEPYKNTSSEETKVLLYGTCFAACLMQKKILPLHCSAVEINGKCVLFVGTTGMGKSTISIILRSMGYKIVSDDVVAVKEADGKYMAYSGIKQHKITSVMAEYLDIDVKKLKKVMLMDEREKYFLPIEDVFVDKPLIISNVIEIAAGGNKELIMEKITGTEKFSIILKNTYRPYFVKFFGFCEDQFKICSGIAKQADVYRVIRPENKMTIKEQIDLIIQTLS